MSLPESSSAASSAEGEQHTDVRGGSWHEEIMQRISPITSGVTTAETSATPARFRALDAFRGLTILLMLLVNNVMLGSSTPQQFEHAPWNAGLTLADYVFPWFLLCVGVAIPFAVASFRRKALPSWRYDVKVLWRATLLVLLGCLIDSSEQRHLIFTLGVLQIIGLAYLVAALLYDLPVTRRLLIAGVMLVSYWAAIKFIPVPGVGAGMFTERGNLIFHLNLIYLNPVRLWGLPSVVPTAALAMIGSAIGDLVRRKELEHWQRIVGLFLLGAGLMLLGWLWNFSLPYNKPLWTPSYVLMTSGAGTLFLCLFYLILDAAQWSQWSYPFMVLGSNAIVAYVAPVLLKVCVLQNWQVSTGSTSLSFEQWLLNTDKALLGPFAGSWCYTLGYIAVWWGVLWVLYRNKWFLRV